jgi:hypothetical protein
VTREDFNTGWRPVFPIKSGYNEVICTDYGFNIITQFFFPTYIGTPSCLSSALLRERDSFPATNTFNTTVKDRDLWNCTVTIERWYNS